MKTTITTSTNHGFKENEIIKISGLRRSIKSKMLAAVVGVICFSWLDRPYKSFVKYENLHTKVKSVDLGGDTFTTENN